MEPLSTLKEANEITTLRLTPRRQRAKVGDIFRLQPTAEIVLWGRVMKHAPFFGLTAPFYLIYIYDSISAVRPVPDALKPEHLLIGPSVVNGLGWSRGYWEIVASEPPKTDELLPEHLFIRFRGFGPNNYDIVDEQGCVVLRPHAARELLSQSGFGNFNSVDQAVRTKLRARGLL